MAKREKAQPRRGPGSDLISDKESIYTEKGTENRKDYMILRAELDNERSTFLPTWRECSDWLMPRRSRFFISDVNRGDRRNQRIINSTGTLAVRTLRSGMMSGLTSPARPWFRLTTQDPDMAEQSDVKDWLYLVTQRAQNVFLRSNIYNSLPIVYGDVGMFATSAMLLEEDFTGRVVRSYAFPIGSYWIANSHHLKTEVFMREYRMTIRQVVERFGHLDEDSGKIDWSNISERVKNYWEEGKYEIWVDIAHVVHPNKAYDPRRSMFPQFKKFVSAYYERGMLGATPYLEIDSQQLLQKKGYDYFPVLCPRWETTAEDSYGTACPGIDAIGDIKQLQMGERRGAQALDKMVNPAMVGPTSLRTQKASILSGDITYVDTREGGQSFKQAHEVSLRLDQLEAKLDKISSRIDKCFYKDMFLMLAESDRREITAREVDEKHEEKLLALGPVVEQLNQDLNDPMLDVVLMMMHRQDMIPPPPQAMLGAPLKIEYLSIMAQAQKLIGISGIERFSTFTASVAAYDPSVVDVVDSDHMVTAYGEMTSVPPGVIRATDQIAAIRQQKQQAQMQQQKLEQIQAASQSAKDLSNTDTAGKNGLTDLMAQAQAGAVAPQ